MNKPSLLALPVALCAALVLSGCHSSTTEVNGVPVPAPHAAPSQAEQMKAVDDNPHIPDAQKASLKATIAKGGGTAPAPPSTR